MGGLCSSEAVEDMQKLGQLARGGAYLLSLVGVRSQRSGRANRGGLCACWDVEFIEAILCKVHKQAPHKLAARAHACPPQRNWYTDPPSLSACTAPVTTDLRQGP